MQSSYMPPLTNCALKGRIDPKVRVSLLVGGPCNVGPGMVVGEDGWEVCGVG